MRVYLKADGAEGSAVVAEAPKKAPRKKAVTKAKSDKGKASPKKKKAAKASEPGEYGVERSHDLPWNEKKVAVFKALKALGATSASGARSAKDIATKAGVSERDVRHYVYHAKAAGLADVADVEGIRGHAYHLSAKGKNVDAAAELKKQEAGKKSK